MKSPLELDNDNVKFYKVPKQIELHPRQKLAFLEDQLHQLKSMHWRARVDMLHSARLQEDENPTLREKGLSNMATHRNEMQQSIGAVEMLSTFIEELKKENPGVDAGEHPEDV